MEPAVHITIQQPANTVEVYDFLEWEIGVRGALPENPFTGAHVAGVFQRSGGKRVTVQGFCDSEDGSVHRLRFMPAEAGEYRYRMTYRQGMFQHTHTGQFTAIPGGRRGLVRVDPAHPFHFQWEGTGEHYFWNATTTYSLLGCQEDVMLANVARLARLKVNRLRVGLSSARVESGRAWYEPVDASEQFTFLLNPWVAERPDSVDNPGFDTARFHLPFWQKVDRLLHFARERDVQISIVFFVDGARPGVYPFGEVNAWFNEQTYYFYAINRLAAFSNVMWDITNEWKLFRSEAWVEWIGNLIEIYDPYGHLTSCHGHEVFPFHKSVWADFVMYQQWDEDAGNPWMLQRRALQARSGHPRPVINEEYGYEDHYPQWGGGKVSPARSADNRRRLAWQIVMAGCYGTTGERAIPDGGWINGRGADDTMLTGYGYMVDFFTARAWWKLEPRNDLVNLPNLCLAEPGKQYIVYLPEGGPVELRLEPGSYQARWFNPRSGEWQAAPAPAGDDYVLEAPDSADWVLAVS